MTMLLQEIPLDDLVLSKDNVREKAGDLEGLAKSLAAIGLIEPIVVTPLGDGKYGVDAGERRTLAARLVSKNPEKYPGPHQVSVATSLPAVIAERTDTQRVLAMLVENLQRVDITPLEEARGYFRLTEEGAMSQTDVANQVGRSKAHVSKRLSLLVLPAEAQKLITSGDMTIETALQLVKLAERPDIIRELIEGDFDKDETEQIEEWRISQALREVEATRELTALVDKIKARHAAVEVVGDATGYADKAPAGQVFVWLEEVAGKTWTGMLPAETSVVEVSRVNGVLWINSYTYADEAADDIEDIPTSGPASGNPAQTAATKERTAAQAKQAAAEKERTRIRNAVNRHEAEHLRAFQAKVAAKPTAATVKNLTKMYVRGEVNTQNAGDLCKILELEVKVVEVAKTQRWDQAAGKYIQPEGKTKSPRPVDTVSEFIDKADANVPKVLVALALLRLTYAYDQERKEALAQVQKEYGWTPFNRAKAETDAKLKATAAK